MYVTVREDDFERKYYDIPDVDDYEPDLSEMEA